MSCRQDDLSSALDGIDRFLARFVAFPSDSDRHAVVLWAVHAHLLDCFDSTPRLVLTSPEKQSGKSRCLEVLALLVPESLHASSITPAAMFRRIAKQPRPTILFDEYDTVWNGRPSEGGEELRALVNSGHRRGASTWRCVGPSHEVTEFPTFAAVALAGIGWLPDTITDRAVVVKMRRRAPGEVVEQYRYSHDAAGYDLRDIVVGVCEAIAPMINSHIPDNPLEDRAADVWEPLLTIGELAGDPWCQRAELAARQHNAQEPMGDSVGVELLRDVRSVWPEDAPSLPVTTLLDLLCADPEMRWSEHRGKHLTARGLAQILKPYGIRSERTASARIYLRRTLGDVWFRYLPSGSGEASHVSEVSGDPSELSRSQTEGRAA